MSTPSQKGKAYTLRRKNEKKTHVTINDNYKITKIVRALSLAERRVCMRVCKHGCVT